MIKRNLKQKINFGWIVDLLQCYLLNLRLNSVWN
nr:MAG TPA: hypothetical protein [Caudoviricetes sp.]